MERLSGDFNRGYTKAIMDAIKIFNSVESDLRHHHKSLTHKKSLELLNCILKNHEAILEGRSGFIRCNSDGDFEFYDGGKHG